VTRFLVHFRSRSYIPPSEARLPGVERRPLQKEARLLGVEPRLLQKEARLLRKEPRLLGKEAGLRGAEVELLGKEAGLRGAEPHVQPTPAGWRSRQRLTRRRTPAPTATMAAPKAQNGEPPAPTGDAEHFVVLFAEACPVHWSPVQATEPVAEICTERMAFSAAMHPATSSVPT
jgi:hypothetical protein